MPDITNLLLTGASGIGKSTLLREVGVSLKLAGMTVRGFYSDVIQDVKERQGWRLDAFDGSDGGVLVHRDIKSERRMGGYGVNLGLLERLVNTQMALDGVANIYLIDEIGIVAPWSQQFVTAMDYLLASDTLVIAIIRARGDGYVQQAKSRYDIEIWEISRANHDTISAQLFDWIQAHS